MGHEHTPAAVANQAQGVQSIPSKINHQKENEQNQILDYKI